MNKICEICGKEYEAKRDTSRYCGPKCRKLAFLSVPEKSEISVPENGKSLSVPVSVPGRDDIWSEQYDTSEAGFRRRNKAWDDNSLYPGTPESRKECMATCKRINADHVSIRVAAIAQRDYEAVSAVRGLVEG
jgi:hypothetical protein